MPKLEQTIQRAVAKPKKTGPKKSSRKSRVKAFFKGVLSELKKVHWPTKQELIRYTGVVIVTVLLMALAISFFDWLLYKPIEWGLSL
jgi:preprotein translocase subunit SecE